MQRDFAVEDALPRLMKWDLVSAQRLRGGESQYFACSIEEAHQRLVAHWSCAYEALGRPPQESNVSLTSLFANPNLELPQLIRQPSLAATATATATLRASSRRQETPVAPAMSPLGSGTANSTALAADVVAEAAAASRSASGRTPGAKSVSYSQNLVAEDDLHRKGVEDDQKSKQIKERRPSLWKRIFKKGR